MLGNFPEDDFERQEIAGELEADLETDRLHSETSQAGENFRSLWNTNTKVNSEITAKTSRAIHSEPFGGKFFCPKKSLAMSERTERGDPLVTFGIVCYAGNLFGSVPWADWGNLKFCITFGRTVLMTSGVSKKH